MIHRSRPMCLVLMIAVCGLGTVILLAEEKANPVAAVKPALRKKVDFQRDVEPIFIKHCNDCHGPDSHEGRLRLDAKKIVFKGGVNGPSIIPGNSEKSLLVQRILGLGDKDRMPVDADPLSDKETALIRAWIDQGANWPDGVGSDIAELEKHWAYKKPVRPTVPQVKTPLAIGNPIDAFVLARLEKAGLSLSSEADKVRLVRRVTLDLLGVPPTISEVDAFLDDESQNAYEKLVDRLLASPRYGERWATPWLDAARYTDSNGYQRDGRRVYWAYRDWIVQALNADMPFDQFTIEQIAGDLLPQPSLSQVIATGFHRGTMANVEAGTDPEEEYFLAVSDRVTTTGTVWLGTSLLCAQCHSHKYDPFTQKEFYQLFAFFNNTETEIVMNGAGRNFIGPKIELQLEPKQQAERSRLKTEVDAMNGRVKELTKQLKSQQPQWETEVVAMMEEGNWQVLDPGDVSSAEVGGLRKLADGSILAGGNFPSTDIYTVSTKSDLQEITAFRLEVLTDKSLPGGGPGRAKPGNFILSEFKVEAAPADQPTKFRPIPLASAVADFSQSKWPVANAIDGNRKTGWAIAPQFGQGHYAIFVPKEKVGFSQGTLLRFTLDQQYGNNRTIGRFQLMVTSGDPSQLGVPSNIRKLVTIPAGKRDNKQKKTIEAFFLAKSSELKTFQNRLRTTQTALNKVAPPTTLVMKERPELRKTFVLKRGDFLSPAEQVQRGTPRILHAMPDDESPNRLTLAKWLVDKENPLVARVTVNRMWAEFFGRGIVETIEEFGSQGEPPSHPQLLDWLATEFMHRNWSVKAIHRLIVTSKTYRQSSHVTPELLERDPYNKLYARGPRFRIKAEGLRDTALSIAGLLSKKMYGPPVFPFQPPGVWNHIGVASNDWKTSSGEDLYRRGLYIYWRRTVPYPSFVNFDTPSREACTVKRSRSNTPLQALTLLNDRVFFEAATALAGRIMTEPVAVATPVDRITYGFRLATSRPPSGQEVDILWNRFSSELERYRKDPRAAKTLIDKWKVPEGANPAEFAAWIYVSNILLNLDEAITKG